MLIDRLSLRLSCPRIAGHLRERRDSAMWLAKHAEAGLSSAGFRLGDHFMATVRCIVADVDQAVEFYCSRLGFSCEQQFGPAMAIVRRNDLTLWLAGPASSAARSMLDGRRPEPGGWNRPVLTVTDLDEIVNGLRAAGASFRNDIMTGPGGRQILLDDPSGNAIELFEPA
jgi:predicted enzyme related to lactoylglutathione lyase